MRLLTTAYKTGSPIQASWEGVKMPLRTQALWLQTGAPPLPCQRQLAKQELQFELMRTHKSCTKPPGPDWYLPLWGTVPAAN